MKLCYIDYPVRMTMDGLKKFKQTTGEDLWSVLVSLINEHSKAVSDGSQIDMYERLYKCIDFETASHALYNIIDRKEKQASIEEIQDGMFRSGWLPGEYTTDENLPWPLVLVSAAHTIHDQFNEALGEQAKKKADS